MVGSYRPTGTLWTKTLAACALAAAVETLPRPADAAPIHHATRAELHAAHSWSSYLLASPSVWSSVHAPAFSPQVRSLIWRQVHATNSTALPMIDYLLWRRSLNPVRFDHYHPKLGPTLANLLNQPTPTTIAPQSLIPSTPTTTPTVAPLLPPETQTVMPNVPEPSSILIALAIGAWGICSRRRLQWMMRP